MRMTAMHGRALTRQKDCKTQMTIKRSARWHVEIMAPTERTYTLPKSVKCLSALMFYLTAKSLTAVPVQVLTDRHVYTLFNRNLDNGHCVVLLVERSQLFCVNNLRSKRLTQVGPTDCLLFCQESYHSVRSFQKVLNC
jgi:hypothetical protein